MIARMAVRTQPTLSPGMSSRIAKATPLSPSSFHKRYRSFYEIPSPSSSSTLPIRKRYRENEGPGSEDEGLGSEEEEEAAPEGQQEAVLTEVTIVDEPLGLGYEALRCHELVIGEGEIPRTLEVGQCSRFVSEHDEVERISAFRQPTLVHGGQLKLYGSILHDHTQRLNALPPTLFEGYDQDLRELYTRSRAVKDEIFLQRYRFRSIEREQTRATVTFGENHDLRMQITKERHERLELTDRVARMKMRQKSREE
nr:hypothetical protein [Tanacetum cinerariifolium]